MSNNQVGSVYAKIIDDVINQCRAPFEEEGASMQTLDDFKKTWQLKISERKVAEMPWDPKAPPPAPAAQAPPQPRQAPPTYVPPQQNGEVKVKVEQNDLANLASATPAYTHHNPNLALQNAAQQVKAQFGDAGSATIQQLNSRIAEAPHGTKRPLPQGSPTQEQYDAKRRMTDYSAQQAAQARAQQIAAAGRPPQHQPINPTQTDGAADWKQMVAERRALAEGSAAADVSIAERVAAMQRAEEGNGVMQPHSKQTKKSAAKVVVARSGTGVAGDAADDEDDEEDDEEEPPRPAADDPDAINSDLDDAEDDNLEDDDDDKIDELMVCTYEKVARVKNKWKCTLKDGILITGGKEYVFGKATGEFEW